jgi:RES domain-containing protein
MGSKDKGGRYNPKGVFEAAYLSYHPYTVVREVRLVDQDAGGNEVVVPTKPLIVMTLQYQLQAVVDLTDADIQSQLGIDLNGDLLCNWEALVLHWKKVPTQILGCAARDADIEGLIVPSARQPDQNNLVMVVDRLRTGSGLRIHDPEGFAPGTRTEIIGDYIPKAKR